MRFLGLAALVIAASASAQIPRRLAPCGAPTVRGDRADCVRARMDSGNAELSRAIGRGLELLPDSGRAPFLRATTQWEDSLTAGCRRRAAGPLRITPASPVYFDCVAASTHARALSLANTYAFQPADPSAHGGCLAYGPDTVTLSGTLERRTYPGRPNYESVARGDEAETGFYLALPRSVCVSRSLDEINQPTVGVSRVQLVLNRPAYARLRPYLMKRVTVRGTLFHSHTGHHHAELLLHVLE